jgi:heme-degrading monooxygenase HmoA
MYVRLVTFTGAKDIDAGVRLVREKVMPLLHDQKGYRGMSASADRSGGVFAVLSVWDTAEERDATESALAKTRQEAAEVVGGELTVETFEQVVAEMGDPPPGPGSALMVTRISMDPAKVDDNIAFFKSEIVPRITATPGFQALRQLMNRATGEGVVGTVWSDEAGRKQAAEDALARRDLGVSRGVKFGETSFREIVFVDQR